MEKGDTVINIGNNSKAYVDYESIFPGCSIFIQSNNKCFFREPNTEYVRGTIVLLEFMKKTSRR